MPMQIKRYKISEYAIFYKLIIAGHAPQGIKEKAKKLRSLEIGKKHNLSTSQLPVSLRPLRLCS